MAKASKSKPQIDHHQYSQIIFKWSLLKAALLHLLIVLGFLFSFQMSSKPLVFAAQSIPNTAQQSEIIEATFIDSNVIEQQRRQKAQAEATARQKQLEQQKELERQRKLKIKREQEAQRKKQQELEQQKIAEQARLDALEKAQKQEAEIAEKRRQQEQRQRELEQELAEQLAQEQAAMQQVAERRIMTELEKYQSLIQQTIQRNINFDGGYSGKYCVLNVKLASNGLVLSAKGIKGDNSLCRVAERAAIRAQTLPVSDDPEVFNKLKEINFNVTPP